MTVTELITAFLRDRQRNGCRPSSLRIYTSRLNSLLDKYGDRPLSTLTRPELLDWLDRETHFTDDYHIEAKRGERKAANTVRHIITLLRMLQKFAINREAIDEPFLKDADLKKPPARRRERLATGQETDQILTSASPEYHRFYQTLRHTGARPEELCRADIEHIQETDGLRTIVLTEHKTSEKTSRPRKIPISSSVAPFIDAAIGNRATGPIFLNRQGRRWTRNQTTSTFRQLRRQAGITEDVKQYCARHEFASAVVKKHGIYQAKELLGHADIKTTQQYAHMQDAELHQCQADLYDTELPGKDNS